ncbi:hypothetical protein DUNSADRAFT_13846 [Dunaliella salina]|uniref:Guanylate cyclase domain-containing protein n=1 Tax=Dunaliella salina TaxID=3046 RepID=A0ABQ7G8M7_DUNSA|nr:hypothetical protein DUNSADRAFT_13846 [Dunaliella salina]|eukprot:KAF5830914.1 hypothetical protein DUNSADRAFT_13846 [Dunaliella salina]
MWETLPDHVCDEAISLHHEITRTQLHIHHGYECGTEGDAFVLAFHTVADALVFAAAVQVELLHAKWPAQLLELEVCRPVYVPLPTMLNRQQSFFRKHLRKSDGGESIEYQEPELRELQKLPSQEVALTLEAATARTPAASRRHSLVM